MAESRGDNYEFMLKAQDAFTKEIDKLKSELKKLGGDLKKYGDESSRATSRAGKGFESMTGDILKAGVVVGAFWQAWDKTRKSLAYPLNFEATRVQFEVLFGSIDQGEAMLAHLSDFAKRTPFTIPQVRETALQMKAYGIETQNIIPTMQMLGDLALGNSERFSRLSYAYGQVKAAQQLYGTETRQFTEATVPLIDALADRFGVTAGEIRKMTESGEISFTDLKESLEKLTSEGGRFHGLMEKSSHTLKGVWSNILDTYIQWTEKLVDTKGYQTVLDYATKLQKSLPALFDQATENVGALAGAIVAVLMPRIIMAGKAFYKMWPLLLIAETGAAIGDAADSLGYLKVNTDAAGKSASVTSRLLGKMHEGYTLMVGNVMLLFRQMVEGMKIALAAISTPFQYVITIFMDVWQNAQTIMGNIVKLAQNTGAGIKAALTGGDFGGFTAGMKDVKWRNTAAVYPRAVGNMSSAWSSLKEAGKMITTGMVLKLKEQKTKDELAKLMGDPVKPPSFSGGGGGGGGKDAAKEAEKAAKEAAKAMQEQFEKSLNLSKSIAELNKNYRELALDGGSALQKLTKEHTASMVEMDAGIAKLKKSIVDIRSELKKSLAELQSVYQQGQGEREMDKAEAVVEQEKRLADARAEYDAKRKAGLEEIADLTKEMKTKEADEKRIALGKELDDLQAKLDKEQAAYDAFFKQNALATEDLNKARENAALTDFERTINEINKQKTEAAIAYEAKRVQMKAEAEQRLADAQAELQQLEDKRATEERVFAAARDQYTKTEAVFLRFKTRFLDGLTAMSAGAEGKLIAIQNRFEALRQLIAEVGKFDPDNEGYSFGGVSSAAAVSNNSTTTNTSNQVINIPVTINGGNPTNTTKEEIIEAVTRALKLSGLASQ